ncbi:MAG: DUF1947 domain-containing protein [Nanoarchaeota archaeon]|nr:DUF1947 domain-containing protein [Nanoarchaeota archaeon]
MRKQLSKSEIKEIMDELPKLGKKDKVEIDKELFEILILNDEQAFFRHEEHWVPLLKYEQDKKLLKEVVVDEGAVKFVANGADIMRPGIETAQEGIKKGELVRIVDVRNKVGLAIGITLFNRTELMAMASGKVITSVHHVGDKLWKHVYQDE